MDKDKLKEKYKRANDKRKLKKQELKKQELQTIEPIIEKSTFNPKITNIYNEAQDYVMNTTNTNRLINDNVEKLKSINEIVGFKNYNWSLAVRAQMGTGKTEKLIEYLEENPHLRVLIASFRKSLISKQFKDLERIGFKTYLDFEGFKIVDEPKMIVQIDSIYKVFGEYDLIILDEVKSINEHLVIQVKNKIKCISALIERVKMTPMLYIADANLIIDDLEFFNKCGRQFTIYNNVYKKHTSKSMSFMENKNIMLNTILDDLTNNKNLILATGSKEFAVSVQETINEKLPHIKVKLYTGGGKYETDPTEEWNEYNCVIYTSCICAGNSFVKKHFDNIYGYFPACSNSPNIALQMLFRCRNFENLFICIEERGNNNKLPFKNLEETKQYIVMKDKIAHKNLKLYVDGYFSITSSVITDELDTNDPYFYLYCNVLNTLNKGKTGYLKVMIQTLKEMGLTLNNSISIKDMNDEQKENILLIQDDLKDRRNIHDVKRLQDISSAEPITKEKYVELQKKLNNDLLTNDEYNSCKKYTIKEHFKITEDTLTSDYIGMIEKNGEKLDRINLILKHKDNIKEKCIQNIADDLNNTENRLEFIINNTFKKYKDTSSRLEKTEILTTTHQIFTIYDIYCAFLRSSTKSKNFYEEIFLNKNNAIYNIDFDIFTEQIYNVIKPQKYIQNIPKKYDGIINDSKDFGKYKTKLLKSINDISIELLGISIKKNGKNLNGDTNYYINREYILINISDTNHEYAIHKDFENKIKFTQDFIKSFKLIINEPNIIIHDDIKISSIIVN